MENTGTLFKISPWRYLFFNEVVLFFLYILFNLILAPLSAFIWERSFFEMFWHGLSTAKVTFIFLSALLVLVTFIHNKYPPARWLIEITSEQITGPASYLWGGDSTILLEDITLTNLTESKSSFFQKWFLWSPYIINATNGERVVLSNYFTSSQLQQILYQAQDLKESS